MNAPAMVKARTARGPAGDLINALGYIGLEVSNLEAWSEFAHGVLGMDVRPGPREDIRYLRMDGRLCRLVLLEGPSDDIAFAGWQVADNAALDAYADRLETQEIAFTWGGPDDLALRGVARMLRFEDPNGVTHEAFVDKPYDETPLIRPALKGGFVVGPGGLGHIVFGSRDYPASVAFAGDVLGAGLSDIIEQPITPDFSVHITFMHVNERHHSIAFANRAGPKKLHHFMIEVERIDDVGRARDRHLKTGLAIAQDIGQHPNDQMISYYGVTPSGFMVEFGWGGVKVDIPSWTPGAYTRMSDWGHRPVAAPAPPSPTTIATSTSTQKETPVSAAGDWNLLITTPMGQQKAHLVLAEDLSGEITAMGVPSDIYDAAFDASTLTFKTDVTAPFPMTLAFDLKIDGAKIDGHVKAGPMGPSPVKGERA